MQRVEVRLKPHLSDARGKGLIKDIADLGISSITAAQIHDVYYIQGNVSFDDMVTICQNALTDSIIHNYHIGLTDYQQTADNYQTYEVTYNPGVTDPIEESVLKAIFDLGIRSVTGIKTATRYELYGSPSDAELQIVRSRLLVNPTVQHIVTHQMTDNFTAPEYTFKLKTIEILSAKSAQLTKIAAELGFSEPEIVAITNYFRKLGDRRTCIHSWSIFLECQQSAFICSRWYSYYQF